MTDNKQRLSYTPHIDYTEDYYSDYNPSTTNQTLNVSTSSSLAQSVNKIDNLLNGLPVKLADALKDVYNPIKDMLYTPYLKDKVIPDKTVQKEIIIKYITEFENV